MALPARARRGCSGAAASPPLACGASIVTPKSRLTRSNPFGCTPNTHAEHRSVHRGRYAGWDDVQPFLDEARALFTWHALAHGMRDFLHEVVPRYLCSCDVSFDDESKLKQHV
jgi:hypothetical protein